MYIVWYQPHHTDAFIDRCSAIPICAISSARMLTIALQPLRRKTRRASADVASGWLNRRIKLRGRAVGRQNTTQLLGCMTRISVYAYIATNIKIIKYTRERKNTTQHSSNTFTLHRTLCVSKRITTCVCLMMQSILYTTYKHKFSTTQKTQT